MTDKRNSIEYVQNRFWAKVQKSDDKNGCWIWTAGKFENGYGAFRANNKQGRAHRFSWELAHGAIPDGLLVLHNCPSGDNPACVNPAHLWLGTHQENMDDCVRKGRRPKGEQCHSHVHPELTRGSLNGRSKLTESEVITIRNRYSAGDISQAALGREYAVSYEAIHCVVRNKSWTHVPTDVELRIVAA